nr:Mor transcription activator family protein [Bacillus sp. FJAT-50079]
MQINLKGRYTVDIRALDSSCFNGVYKELVELIGHKNTILIHSYFAGQYVTFPKKVLSEEYLHQQIVHEYNGKNAKELARKYDYSYSWIMKILKKYN